VVFATQTALIIATFFFRRASVKAYDLARERVSAVNADLQESVSGLRIVQAFRREREGERRFTERSAAYRSARIRGQWLISVYFPDRKSTRLNSSHVKISYAVFCLKKKTNIKNIYK